MTIEQISLLVQEKRIIEALDKIKPHLENVGLFEWRSLMASWNAIEPFRTFVRLFDYALMYRHSGLVARYAHRKFNTLQTLAWVCDEWLENRRPLDVEEALVPRLTEALEGRVKEPRESIARAAFALVRALLDMQRIDEAREWMDVVARYETVPMHDKWGYFYIETGDRKRAEQAVRAGMDDPERGDMCYLLLSDLYALDGRHQEALAVLEEGKRRFPQVLAFYAERVRRLRDVRAYREALAAMDELDRLNPLHMHRRYFTHLRAELHYRLGEWEKLESLVKAEPQLEKTPYARALGRQSKRAVVLPLVPVVQKHNYCVPASLEMMLRLLGSPRTQDEVAQHIFDVRGSKLSTTVRYLEDLGFTCRFFIGSPLRWKRLIDEGVPVLLSVDYEQSSHVQVLFGYDERLEAFYVQDPNLFDPFVVSEDELAKWYAGTHYLSIVALPREKAALAAELPEEEDRYFRELHALAEKMDEDEQAHFAAFVAFLRKHEHIPYTWLYVMKHFSSDEAKPLVLDYTGRVLSEYPEHNDLLLMAAKAYVYTQEMEQAEDVLKRVKGKAQSPIYHYLRGRIAFFASRYEEAARYFRASLQLDTDQPEVWSYWGLASAYAGQIEKGLVSSRVAVSLYPGDLFIETNHGVLLFYAKRFAEARDWFDHLVRRERRDAQLWYERARCDQELGRRRKAERGFCVAKTLDPQEPYPYLMLADLYHDAGDREKAKTVLEEGLAAAWRLAPLYVRLGDLYMEEGEAERAVSCYEEAIRHDSEDVFAHLGLAAALAERGDAEAARRYVIEQRTRFADNSEYCLNAGRWLVAHGFAEEEEERNTALSLLEEGLRLAEFDAEEAYEFYLELLTTPILFERGRTFLEQLVSTRPKLASAYSALGVLYERQGRPSKAMDVYREAAAMGHALSFFRLAELCASLGRYEEAKQHYEACLKADPSFAPCHFRLAALYEAEGNEERQHAHLLQAVRLAPLRVDIEQLAAIIEPSALLQALADARPHAGEAWYYDSLGYVYEALGRRDQEKTAVEKALALAPDDREVLRHWARVLGRQGRTKEAVKLLEQLIARHPDDESLYPAYVALFPKTMRGLGKLRHRLERLKTSREAKSVIYRNAAASLLPYLEEERNENDEPVRWWTKAKEWMGRFSLFSIVIDLYEEAIRLNPSHAEAYGQLARLYAAIELEDDAVKTWRKALARVWDPSLAREFVEHLLKADEEKKRQEAKRWLERLVADDPDDIELRVWQAVVWLQEGQHEKAERQLQEIVAEEPLAREALMLLGEQYRETGRVQEAASLWERYADWYPEDEEFHMHLAAAYEAAGFIDQALAAIERCVHAAKDARLRYERARYLALLGRFDEAKQELEEALAADESGELAMLAADEPVFHPLGRT
ncbi:bacteriocin-processing peptidase family protein [Geobacillus sp. BMUD]|uniref:bacteriocin-processing peptidase family protein n=1 Tax=Geobacillus sp. BMUD TaxID=2508876 RepID=UPI00149101E1|nr:bacteriocin-processing peptidase family protein [Geobacillus sp. BMUD]NNU84662.1 bacteriocin-processing peptidase family protein [Geobacillus sp. BMUD]